MIGISARDAEIKNDKEQKIMDRLKIAQYIALGTTIFAITGMAYKERF
ncbi:MAG: hypothetical protein NC419_00635 [Muribaculaceae bacterium]|nr:hypothetical protein [Muribaculaceae bacterium]